MNRSGEYIKCLISTCRSGICSSVSSKLVSPCLSILLIPFSWSSCPQLLVGLAVLSSSMFTARCVLALSFLASIIFFISLITLNRLLAVQLRRSFIAPSDEHKHVCLKVTFSMIIQSLASHDDSFVCVNYR